MTPGKLGLRVVDFGDGLITVGTGDQRALERACALAVRLMDLRDWRNDETRVTGTSSWLRLMVNENGRKFGTQDQVQAPFAD